MRRRYRRDEEYVAWRRKVKRRDNSKCRVCGLYKYVQVHHVLPKALVPERTYDVTNGIVLCRYHHVELHRKRLDVVLFPVIYEGDAAGLGEPHQLLADHPLFETSFTGRKPLPKNELLRAVPNNYQKELRAHHPEWAVTLLGPAPVPVKPVRPKRKQPDQPKKKPVARPKKDKPPF